ncbi:MAG: 16S rRNA (cytidine(1402)-2'-O)-methyltransferase [Defluviitaleaceae bacterium]|nr:16S rRNA (cytidine(1402)-2'-O)-methyltransferase [Defluviitaleaceae bacterium]
MLYICGTPIGNLEDITIRQLRILEEVDIIAAEDTRHSKKLLSHFDIKTPLISYHEYSRENKKNYIIEKLLKGKSIALITDSGMPLISDPGIEIVKECYNKNIPITTIPGPTAFVSAFVMSGFYSTSFTFYGFLTKNQKKNLSFLKKNNTTAIIYESPHKLLKTLILLKEELGENQKIAIAREITKLYEQILCFTLKEAVNYYENNKIIGEFVLVLEQNENENENEISTIPLDIQVSQYIEQGYSKKESIKKVAKDMNIPKSEVYKFTIVD